MKIDRLIQHNEDVLRGLQPDPAQVDEWNDRPVRTRNAFDYLNLCLVQDPYYAENLVSFLSKISSSALYPRFCFRYVEKCSVCCAFERS